MAEEKNLEVQQEEVRIKKKNRKTKRNRPVSFWKL